MKYGRSFRKYCSQLAREANLRPLHAASVKGIDKVVVIPCLAESRYLFDTLNTLSRNDPPQLEKCLVLCVVNNKTPDAADVEVIADNQLTMECLDMLIRRQIDRGKLPKEISADTLNDITKSEIKVAYIDAASPGRELPRKGGGVGMARKIGLDCAMMLFENDDVNLLYCLDADTLVEENYLSAVDAFFKSQNATSACVPYEHQESPDQAIQTAILLYELFLHYYVAGLNFADSPYAFHTVGSTIICTADGYAAVRGINSREAGEDFYFLNKLIKLGGVYEIGNTTVHPSARPSKRVPFGTGRAVSLWMEKKSMEYPAYHPDVFLILKEWLLAVRLYIDRDAEFMMNESLKINPLLKEFLEEFNFCEIWKKLAFNAPSETMMHRQFHRWFDGFKTLRLINYLSRNGVAPVNLIDAVILLLKKMAPEFLRVFDLAAECSSNDEKRRLLDFLRYDLRIVKQNRRLWP